MHDRHLGCRKEKAAICSFFFLSGGEDSRTGCKLPLRTRQAESCKETGMHVGAVAGRSGSYRENQQLRVFRPVYPEFERVDVDIDCTE
jgi:hypothetical protein